MKSNKVQVEVGEFLVYENGDIFNAKTNKKLKPYDNGIGYLRVGLYCGNNKSKSYYVHRLMAMAFIPNLENKQFINHIDGNPKNNNIYNLEWCTKSENSLHAYKTGLKKPSPNFGEKNGNTYITNETVLQIKNLYKSGIKQCNIARQFNISKFVVYNIVNNKTWKHIN